MEPLTSVQVRILTAIRTAVRRDGYPPSVRDIGAEVGLRSASSVAYQLSELARKGYIVRAAGKPRALRIIDPQERAS